MSHEPYANPFGDTSMPQQSDALRARVAQLEAVAEAYRHLVVQQDWLIQCVNRFSKQTDARAAIKEAKAALEQVLQAAGYGREDEGGE